EIDDIVTIVEHTVPTRPLQPDRDTSDTGLTRILHTVTIKIQPHRVPNTAHTGVAEVLVEVLAVLGQYDSRCRVEPAVGIARVAQARWERGGRRSDRDGVGTGLQPRRRQGDPVVRQPEPVAVGHVRARPARPVDVDGDARDARLTGILDAVGVDVVPDEVA